MRPGCAREPGADGARDTGALGSVVRLTRLDGQEGALGAQATGVSRERAVGADHPVARDDDRQRVEVVRAADGARGGGPADAAG